MVHRELIRNKADLGFYQDAMISICDAHNNGDYNDMTAMFLLKVHAMFVPQHLVKNIKRLTLLKKLMSPHQKKHKFLASDVKHIPIETLHTWLSARKSAHRLVALCPFHDEKTPSFHIFLKQNKFHCFGCTAKGDVIDFVSRLHGLSFIQSINYLARS